MKEQVVFCWSGGKDSAMALYELQASQQYDVVALLTTVTRDYDRISMHGVRRDLLHRQAASIGIPLHEVWISMAATNAEYEAQMDAALEVYRAQNIDTVVFGDIFLEDLRQYRERNLAKVGMRALFPVWKRDTRELVTTFLQLGFKAVVCCIDGKVLAPSFAGRAIDDQFLADLPPGIDPCGENGEFHSFVYDGPLFTGGPVQHSLGEATTRGEFTFRDLRPIDLKSGEDA